MMLHFRVVYRQVNAVFEKMMIMSEKRTALPGSANAIVRLCSLIKRFGIVQSPGSSFVSFSETTFGGRPPLTQLIP